MDLGAGSDVSQPFCKTYISGIIYIKDFTKDFGATETGGHE